MQPGFDMASLVFLLMTALVITLVVGYFVRRANARIAIERKINQASGKSGRDAAEEIQLLEQTQQKNERRRAANILLMRFFPSLKETQLRLRRSGLGVDISLYAVTLIFIAFALAQTGVLPSAVPPWAWTLFLPVVTHLLTNAVILEFLITRRKRKIIVQISEALDSMVRGVQVGQSPEEALQEATDEVRAPLRAYLQTVGRLVDAGVPLAQAMEAVSEEIDLTEYDFVIAAVAAQGESGGNLSEALINLIEIIRARHQLEEKVKALTAEGKISAALLGSLPFGLFIYMLLANREYVDPLLSTDAGLGVLYGAFVLVGVGILVMIKMVKIKV